MKKVKRFDVEHEGTKNGKGFRVTIADLLRRAAAEIAQDVGSFVVKETVDAYRRLLARAADRIWEYESSCQESAERILQLELENTNLVDEIIELRRVLATYEAAVPEDTGENPPVPLEPELPLGESGVG